MKHGFSYASLVACLFTATLFYSQQATAAAYCEAVALRDISAVENSDPTAILKQGSIDEEVTQYRVDKHSGISMFCSHGGYCYPDHMRVNEKKVPVLQLNNCKIGKKIDEDDDYLFYSVNVKTR